MSRYKILENRPLTADVYNLVLEGQRIKGLLPGQFVQVEIPGFYLRRPISLCDVQGDRIRLIYKILGQGTRALTKINSGDLDLLVGLGNGFFPEEAPHTPLLVGGGVGIPPLFYLAKDLIQRGHKPEVFLGFNKKEEIFLAEEFRDLGLTVHLATMDGSQGLEGTALDLLDRFQEEGQTDPDSPPYVYTCGPRAMLRALTAWMADKGIRGQVSMEERMACGFGACMGCTIQTKSGPRRVCKNGPVFPAEEVLW